MPDDVVRAMRLAALQRFAARHQRHSATVLPHRGSTSAPPKMVGHSGAAVSTRRPSRAVARLDFGGGAPPHAVATGRGATGGTAETCVPPADGAADIGAASETAARLAVRDGDWKALNRRSGQQDLPQTPIRAAAAARAHGITPALLAQASASAVSARDSRVLASRSAPARDIRSAAVF